jgi:ParB-like chromosome segregation protein Spo0J
MNSNQQEVMPEIKMVALDSIHKNPDNPRIIKDDKFKKLVASVIKFPEMLSIRPVVVDIDMMILGGNMRYEACKSAGLKEIPIIMADGLTEEQKKEFIIKDNVSGGEWDWSELANEWDVSELEEWGLDVPVLPIENIDLDEDDSKESSGLEKCTCPKCGFKWNKENA